MAKECRPDGDGETMRCMTAETSSGSSVPTVEDVAAVEFLTSGG
jgi:hypothetical protein